MKAANSRILLLAALISGCSAQNDDGGAGSGGSSGQGGRGGAGGSAGRGGSGGSTSSVGSGGTSAGGSGGNGAGGAGGAAGGSGGAAAGGTGGGDDAGGGAETGTPADTGSPPGTAACGTTPAGFNLTPFGHTEGLVIAPDGTVFMSDFGPHVMRYAPPYDKVEKTWATVAGATILGIMYDPKKKVVYAGSRGGDKMLYKIDATDPKPEPVVAVEGGFNGMTLADDGSLFYSDQTGGTIYRVTPDDKKKTMVAKVPDANGVAFGPPPNRDLFVLTYGNGNITQIKLENNVEKSQALFVKLPKGSADGIAFDKLGNLYATAGALWKVTPDKTTTMVNPTGGANVEFGVGALSCKLIIWAATPPKQMEIDVEGMDVPWHRP